MPTSRLTARPPAYTSRRPGGITSDDAKTQDCPAQEKTRRDDLIVADRACGLSLVTSRNGRGLQRGSDRASGGRTRTARPMVPGSGVWGVKTGFAPVVSQGANPVLTPQTPEP